jgi:hypothetical protein
MAQDALYDVFLIHSTLDLLGVERLASYLETAGFTLYVDGRHSGDGVSWRYTTQQALAGSRTFVIVLGPSGFGFFEKAEIEGALARWASDKRHRRVVVVLLPGASPAELPHPLHDLTRVDLRNGLDDAEALHQIVSAMTDPAPAELAEEKARPTEDRPVTRQWAFRRPVRNVYLVKERSSLWSRFRPRLKEVWLATAAPPSVARNSTFVAKFSAYTLAYRNQVIRAIEVESPGTKLFLDLHACQWEPGTKVTVALWADHLHVEEPLQSFVWNGKWVIVQFDISVPDGVDEGRLILKFDVSIEGLTIARLRPELRIVHGKAAPGEKLTIAKSPNKAFASYASPDRREVLGRVRSLQIFTRIDVFLDCLSLHPGESWKSRLMNEITQRDIFWLFWSRNALQSEWVEWEWRAALAAKTLDYIQPHPLEGPDIAPPPTELAALQFGTLYESYLGQMRSSWLYCRITQCRRTARRVLASYWTLASILLLGVVYFIWFR